MTDFLTHPKFYLPLLLLLLIELFFRSGFWGVFTKPNSYAGQAHDVISAAKTAGPEPLKQITIGDSRTLLGLDHRRILAERRQQGGIHANLSIPGSHLATFHSQVDWVNRELPQIETITLGLTDSMLASTRNGLYEMSIAGPFQPFLPDDQFVSHFRHYSEELDVLGLYSSFFQYRDDLRSLLSDPIHRAREIKTRFTRGSDFSLFRVNTTENDLCGFDFSDINACRANRNNPDWDDPVNHTLRHVVETECYSARAEIRLQSPQSRDQPTPDRAITVSAWQSLIQQVIEAGLSLEIVLLPEHSLLTDHFNQADASTLITEIIAPFRQTSGLVVLDLRTLGGQLGEGGECAHYADLLHASHRGMQTLTDAYLAQSLVSTDDERDVK